MPCTDASRLNPSDGEAFTDWPDLSGQFNDASAFAGEPTLAPKALNGRPAVQIDKQDLIRTQKSFNNRYSIFSVSRLSGSSNERLFPLPLIIGFLAITEAMRTVCMLINGSTCPTLPLPRIHTSTLLLASVTIIQDSTLTPVRR